MTEDKIIYQDRPGRRVLDLRPHGIDCIPVLGLSDFRIVHPGTDFHIHPGCIEICLCVRGNLAFETAERTYPFLPGSIFVSTDREPHRMRSNPKGLVIYRVLLKTPKPGQSILSLPVRESEWLVRSLLHLPKRLFKSTPRVRESFRFLFATYDGERFDAARRVKLRTGVLDLLISVIESARALPPKAPDAIAALLRTMHEHPERDYPVGRLAKELSLSGSGFSEIFKRTAGLPPHAYLLSCRITRAQQMLRSRNPSLKAIAEMLRFSSTRHFATVFKKIAGSTPSDYARLNRA